MTKIVMKDNKYFTTENGTDLTPIERIVDDGKTLKLAPNQSNRQYYSIERFHQTAKDVDGRVELELTYKPPVKITSNGGTKRQVKPLEDYLEGDDKATYTALKQKAIENRDKANTKPAMTEIEKAQLRLKKAQQALEAAEAASKK